MKIEKYIKSITYSDRTIVTYILLVFLRIILIFIPQFGYIHPDEFFQTVEPIIGDKFDLEVVRTWEFNASFPIRSIVLPYLLIKIPLNALEFINLYIRYFFEIELITSYTLLIFPRLCMCLLSFVNDYSLYKICQTYGLKYDTRLLLLASSYVMLIFSTRTFSNTLEMAFCSYLLFIVSECMIHSNTVIHQNEFLQGKYNEANSIVDKVKIFKMKSALPGHTFNKCILISTLCVAGVFNRPTFLFFGMPIVFFWLLRGLGSKTITFVDFNVRIILFVLSAIPSLLLFTIIDSIYYTYLTMEEITRLEIGIDSFVFTPLNFIKYNIDSKNTAKHGAHPWYLHALVNIPLLYNILGIVTIFSIGHLIYRFSKGEYRHLPRAQSIVGLMTASILVPVTFLSLINHQEPRFLIPITLPVILLHTPKIQTSFCKINPFNSYRNYLTDFIYKKILSGSISKHLLKLWYIINIFFTLFYGFIHQGGVVQIAQHFSNELNVHSSDVNIHLVTSHIYNLPLSLIMIPNPNTLYINSANGQKYRKDKRFFLYEYGGIELQLLYKKLKLLIDVCEMKYVTKKRKYRLYLVIPSSLTEDLNLEFYKSNSTLLRHKQLKIFFPHLSTEALPKLTVTHPCEVNTDFFEIDHTCSAYEHDIENESFLSVKSILRQFSSIVHQFGLVLYQIEIVKKKL